MCLRGKRVAQIKLAEQRIHVLAALIVPVAVSMMRDGAFWIYVKRGGL